MGKRRILIIDNEASFTSLLKVNLEDTGMYDVWVESRGEWGLAAAREFKPDLILLDVVIPDKDGGDVASQIKADQRVKNTPIVFLTAAVTKEEVDSEGGIIAGHPFIAKPVSVVELMDCIEKNIGR